MLKWKKLASLLLAGALTFTFTACESSPSEEKTSDLLSIGESPVAMKTVTQDSEDGYVTYTFEIPEDWSAVEQDYFTVVAMDSDNPEIESLQDLLSFSHAVRINNYYYSALSLSKEEQKAYQDLLAGDPQHYKEMTEESIARNNELLEEYAGYKVQLTNFQCSYYQGRSGTLVLVQVTTTNGTSSATEVRCFREDIPQYMVMGLYNDQLELSSGEIARYVMDSLQVEEHFTVDDGMIHKEGE